MAYLSSTDTTGKAGSTSNVLRINNRLTTVERFFKLLLITSLFFKFKGCRDPKEADLSEFNEQYNLVRRLDALWIPATLAPSLWRNIDTVDLLLKVTSGWISISDAVSVIKKTVPRIGHYKGMEKDIERVLADSLEIA